MGKGIEDLSHRETGREVLRGKEEAERRGKER